MLYNKRTLPAIAYLSIGLFISSCTSSTPNKDNHSNKNPYNTSTTKHVIVRTETIDSNAFELIQGHETIITIDHTEYYSGYIPVKMNGKEIFYGSNTEPGPELTANGNEKVSAINAILHRNLPITKEKCKLTFLDFVIDQAGKVVFYICEPVAIDSTTTDKDLEAFNKRSRPVIDSLKPLLLAISFDTATVKGVTYPLLVRYIPAIRYR